MKYIAKNKIMFPNIHGEAIKLKKGDEVICKLYTDGDFTGNGLFTKEDTFVCDADSKMAKANFKQTSE